MVVTLILIYRFINQLSTIDQVKSLSIVEEDCPDKRFKGFFIVESALSLSSQFTDTTLKHLETNNSNTT